MESICASAPPAREPENIKAAGKASDPLTVPKVRKGRETNVPCPRETESMGAREINMPEKETAAMRRDGEALASAAIERRQKEGAANRHQATAGERPPSSAREGIGPVPLLATDLGRKMRDAVGSNRPQLTAAKADRVETSRDDSRLSCDPAVRLRLEATSALARDPIEWMERQRPTAGGSVESSPDIDVERHSCSTTDQQARLAAMKEQLASIAAQPQVLWLSTAGADTSAPAETGLVPAEADLMPAEADQGSAEEQLVPAQMQLVPAEADLVPAEADQRSAEEQLVPAQMQLVPAQMQLVPAQRQAWCLHRCSWCLQRQTWYLQRQTKGLQRSSWCLRKCSWCLQRQTWCLQRHRWCLQERGQQIQHARGHLQR